jgi:TonB-linked SusC/RagA family outer membrane protein
MNAWCRSRRAVPSGRWLASALAVALVSLAMPVGAQAQTGTVTGQVVHAETGAPLANAQVVIVGTTRGTLTDSDGNYRITGVRAGSREVRAQLIGYRAVTQAVEVVADQVASADFRLAETAVALDELVVTGVAGETQRRAIGNVVDRLDAADIVERAPIARVQDLLTGRSAGVVITPGTGMVGSGSRIRIRGASSFSLSNQPLLYVDGVRVDNAASTGPAVQAFGASVISRINDFNPRDIESIEIIKGPAAATLYGTEASNGVIQIITKRGAAGTPSVNMTMRQGANWFGNQEGRVPTNYWRNPDTGEVMSLNLAQSERALGTPLWRTGHLQGYNLNLSGGAENIRYYIAGDWEREEGADRDNMLQRGSGRANLTITPFETLEVTGSLGYVRARTDLACEAGCGGVTWASYFSTPAHTVGDQAFRRGARSLTPEAYWEIYDRFQNLSRTTGSTQLTHRPVEWFSHRLTFGMDEAREDNQTVVERSPIYQEWFPSGTGGKDVGRREATNTTFDYNGTVSVPVMEGLASSTTFGLQVYRRATHFVSASGSDFALPGLRVINAAAETSGAESFVENTTVGVFGQQQFAWQDRLFLTLGLRADDNSAFGEEFELIYYPKASASWVVSEEPFWNIPAVETLRLRAAYGHTGLQPGAFDALRTFVPVAGPGDVSTITPGSVGNPELAPERSEELELGFEAGFFGDRLGVEVTGYTGRTRDAILLEAVAPSTGFSGSRFVNVGEISKRGLELVLRGTPVVTPNVGWDVNFNVGFNRNEVVDLGGPESVVVDAAFGVEHRVGMPLGGWYHRRVVDAQFDETGRFIRESLICDDGAGGTMPCYDGATVIAPNVFLGNTMPQTEGGLSTTLTLFRDLRLSGMLDFNTGYRKWDHLTRVRCALFNVCLENADPLQFVGTQEDRARLAAYQTGAVFGAEYINDSGFARLRELSASYTLPGEWAQRIGASRATISMAGRNLITWTNWTGMEPEAMFMGGARAGFVQLEQNHLPQIQQFVTTINLSF